MANSRKINVLVLGASGFLGSFLSSYFTQYPSFSLFTSSRPSSSQISSSDPSTHIDFDFENEDDHRKLKEYIKENNITALVNCICYKKNDSYEAAKKLNYDLPAFLDTLGVQCITIGTDITSSEKFDKEIPYVKSKKLLEDNSFSHSLILRTTFYGISKNHPSFISDFIFGDNKEYSGYGNYVFSGVSILELARTIAGCIHMKKKGVLNVFSQEPISKYDLLLLFKERFAVDKSLNKGEYAKDILLSDPSDFLYPNHKTMVDDLFLHEKK